MVRLDPFLPRVQRTQLRPSHTPLQHLCHRLHERRLDAAVDSLRRHARAQSERASGVVGGSVDAAGGQAVVSSTVFDYESHTPCSSNSLLNE